MGLAGGGCCVQVPAHFTVNVISLGTAIYIYICIFDIYLIYIRDIIYIFFFMRLSIPKVASIY